MGNELSCQKIFSGQYLGSYRCISQVKRQYEVKISKRENWKSDGRFEFLAKKFHWKCFSFFDFPTRTWSDLTLKFIFQSNTLFLSKIWFISMFVDNFDYDPDGISKKERDFLSAVFLQGFWLCNQILKFPISICSGSVPNSIDLRKFLMDWTHWTHSLPFNWSCDRWMKFYHAFYTFLDPVNRCTS